jgi:hypothetical protein
MPYALSPLFYPRWRRWKLFKIRNKNHINYNAVDVCVGGKISSHENATRIEASTCDKEDIRQNFNIDTAEKNFCRRRILGNLFGKQCFLRFLWWRRFFCVVVRCARSHFEFGGEKKFCSVGKMWAGEVKSGDRLSAIGMYLRLVGGCWMWIWEMAVVKKLEPKYF